MTREYGLKSSHRGASTTNWRWLYLPFMVLLGFFAASWATQQVAISFGFHSALGQPWSHWQGIPVYAPWSVFVWQNKYAEHYALIEHYITLGQAIFLAPQFIILGCWLGRRGLKGNADLHGSAHWATEDEIQQMGYFEGKGVYVGGWVKRITGIAALWCLLQFQPREKQFYLRTNGPEHIMVFAPTRSGKGIGLILPTLLAWMDSSLVLDIKGENWALTAGYLQSLGHTTLRFDPSDASGASACFNPLEEVRLDTLRAIPDVQNIATMIIDPDGKGMADHWSKAGFAFIAGALMHCLVMLHETKNRAATLYDLGNMLADESCTIQELFQAMLETDHATLVAKAFPNGATGGDEIHTFVASSAREMMNKAENEASGVVSTALVNLALYRDPVVAANTSKCDFRINDLMNHDTPVNLYLVISPADRKRLRPLLRLILNMVIGRICEKMEFADGASKAGYKHRLLLMLDEFTSLGKMEIIEEAIAFAAGYGCKMYIIVQDINQLTAVYGDKNAIMANCHIRVAYAPNTIETAKVLSELTGKTTVVAEKVSLSGSRTGHMKNASMSVSETGRPLLTPDECMRLPGAQKNSQGMVTKPGDMLIFTAGQSPIYGRQILYFRDPVFSQRAKIPAPGLSQEFPCGITDSLYYPRPGNKQKAAASASVVIPKKDQTCENYF